MPSLRRRSRNCRMVEQHLHARNRYHRGRRARPAVRQRPAQAASGSGRTAASRPRAVDTFVAHPRINEVVVALPAGMTDDSAALPPAIARSRLCRHRRRAPPGLGRARFSRCRSRSEIIVIHDAARPFASAAISLRGRSTRPPRSGAALAALPPRYGETRQARTRATDAIRRRDAAARVNLPRPDAAGLSPRRVLEALRWRKGRCHRRSDAGRTRGARRAAGRGRADQHQDHHTERSGAGRRDCRHGCRQTKPPRTGSATTCIDWSRGGRSILGGVTIPSDRGPLGHSDADVVCHAITDAISAPPAVGDIGRHFPDTDAALEGRLEPRSAAARGGDDRRAGIRGRERRCVGRFSSGRSSRRYIDAMRATVAGALRIAADRVSIKGKTNEGLERSAAARRLPRMPCAVHAIARIAGEPRVRFRAQHESPLRSKSDRPAARRQRSHGAVQLAAGARLARHVRAAHRGHRCRAIDARIRGGDCRRSALARPRLGRRARHRRRVRAVPQSERLHLYQSYAKELLAAGNAYYCFCSREQLEAERQAALAAGRPAQYAGTCRSLSSERSRGADRGRRAARHPLPGARGSRGRRSTTRSAARCASTPTSSAIRSSCAPTARPPTTSPSSSTMR